MSSIWSFHNAVLQEDSSDVYKVLKYSCCAIVLPILYFILPRPHCRHHHGLLTIPYDYSDWPL